MVNVSTYYGQVSGAQILLLGGIHGDERCGTTALSLLKFEIESGLLPLKAGKVTIVPVCNPAAYLKYQRYIDHNLNRIISRYKHPTCPEEICADEVAKLIEQSDIILDLHSYSSGKAPFLFLDKPTPDNIELANSLGLEHWLTGWEKLYNEPLLSNEPTDTVQYAYRHGKTAMLVECGQHADPSAVNVAYHCARQVLGLYGLIGDTLLPNASQPHMVEFDQIIRRDKKGNFARNWQNFDPIKNGEILINYEDGSSFAAPYDGVIILPNAKAAEGHEWLYLGKTHL